MRRAQYYSTTQANRLRHRHKPHNSSQMATLPSWKLLNAASAAEPEPVAPTKTSTHVIDRSRKMQTASHRKDHHHAAPSTTAPCGILHYRAAATPPSW